MRILLAEDDTSLGETITSWLEMDGYVVDWVKRGQQAYSALQNYSYGCILLDRGLPELTGDQLLASVRQQQLQSPVLMITARDSIKDRVEGLDLGADDYLVKPFDLEELSARIRAAVRKYTAQAQHYLCWREVELDPVAKTVSYQKQQLNLTAREYVVLYKLLRHPQHIVSKEQLEDELYGWGEEIESNAIEVYIYNLRKKISPDFIRTIRRQGYTLSTLE
ncbi:response regulator transcription factor [Acinetobacter qingfengensis]|uniref:DNA-binding response regulator n=1 Tax=Acinetobacter qingfengensis TaxID=1262585 RepID=A0A1E7RDI8_9GAMM|nr:response regulator transcription factor [Acinetobacter qingfengensis]KAA8732155.1 response regulator transcription factor [Acinetobacter qingfengensis]OEY97235.1 DNA-binding response regulator [Acinetobacter qingfengensis]